MQTTRNSQHAIWRRNWSRKYYESHMPTVQLQRNYLLHFNVSWCTDHIRNLNVLSCTMLFCSQIFYWKTYRVIARKDQPRTQKMKTVCSNVLYITLKRTPWTLICKKNSSLLSLEKKIRELEVKRLNIILTLAKSQKLRSTGRFI